MISYKCEFQFNENDEIESIIKDKKKVNSFVIIEAIKNFERKIKILKGLLTKWIRIIKEELD